MTSKILKEALLQRREIQEEGNAFAFAAAEEEGPAAAWRGSVVVEEEDQDVDNFAASSDTQAVFRNDHQEEFNEDDENLLETFLPKNGAPQYSIADRIIEKLREQDGNFSSEIQPLSKLDESAIDTFRGVGKVLSKYTGGKIPKAFKHILSMQPWEDFLHLTEPENWSPNAMYQATRIFASNLPSKKAERFYRLVLLPRVRDDIRKNKRLHFALYQALKKSLYKPAAFNKGILFPLFKSGTFTLREAVIVGSIIQKFRFPVRHASVTLLELAEMEYCGTRSYLIKLFVEKKYALPHRVVGALVAHFMRSLQDTRTMPVIWHQSLLAFVQRYKNNLKKEDIRTLVDRQNHKLVTPEITRELDSSRYHREEEDDPMLLTSLASVTNKPIEEDRFDIPDVPMEEH